MRRAPDAAPLLPGDTHWELALDAPGSKTFRLRAAKPGPYALFTEHLPSELALRIEGASGALEPVVSRELAPGHTHDESVTSVGVRVEGRPSTGPSCSSGAARCSASAARTSSG